MANSDSGSDDFSGNIKQINNLISIKLSKWHLSAGIPSISPEDIRQLLLIHVHRQWEKYNKELPLGNWLNTVLKNRIFNLQREFYHKYAHICAGCPSNSGGQCKIFGNIESEDCNLYKNWRLTKKASYDVNLPVSLENHLLQVSSMPFQEINFDDQLEHLKIKLQTKLSQNDYKIFLGLYIDNKTEAELSKELGYKISTKTEVNRQIKNVKATILDVVKKILKEED
jgi:hypothetical protein